MSIDIYSILSTIPHNHHYLKRYINFIKGCQQKNVDIEEYVEHHHICPKCLFPEYKKLSENKWNGTYLTARQHFIAHWILWKTFPSSKMSTAFWGMCNGWGKTQKTNSKIYEKIKIDNSLKASKWMTGKKASEETKEKMSKSKRGKNNPMYGSNQSGINAPMYGRKHTEETKEKMSKSNTGKNLGNKLSKETKEKIGNASRGRKHTEETKEKISKNHACVSGENNPMYGKKQKTKTCPYCGKTVSTPNFTRWHGDNCKYKNS